MIRRAPAPSRGASDVRSCFSPTQSVRQICGMVIATAAPALFTPLAVCGALAEGVRLAV